MKPLTPKQQAFVTEYLVDLNATQAAIRAGYSAKTAHSIGDENLSKPEIARAVQAAMAERTERTQISQDWVLQSLKSVADRCMQVEPVKDRKGEQVLVETPTGALVPAYTFNAAGAVSSLGLLGKHLGMFKERVEHSGPDGGPIAVNDTAAAARIAAILEAARSRKPAG